MERTITLGGKEYKLASSLFTIISYRQVFGTELFTDVDALDKALQANKEDVGKFIDILFRIVFILHKPFTTITYDKFLQGFDFSVLNSTDELSTLATVIAELLGSVNKNKAGGQDSPR
ncbi:MAG: hypothetical protein AB7E23_00045 [Bacilli bacterium]